MALQIANKCVTGGRAASYCLASTRAHRSTLLHYISANGVEDFRQKTPPRNWCGYSWKNLEGAAACWTWAIRGTRVVDVALAAD
jgi:hypothetical protein